MGRPTAQDKEQLRSILIQTGVALLIAFALLVIVYLWLFRRLVS
jgi:flagellar biogenesis protein FliO